VPAVGSAAGLAWLLDSGPVAAEQAWSAVVAEQASSDPLAWAVSPAFAVGHDSADSSAVAPDSVALDARRERGEQE
jgi:hypothetical protein